MKNLISMTDFVLKDMEIFNSIICEDKHELENYKTLKTKIENYANFLKQPLELWMFVPCDENGNVLKDRGYEDMTALDLDTYYEEHKAFLKAKERVLFEGFNEFLNNVSNGVFELNTETFHFSSLHDNRAVYGVSKIVEDLIGWNLELTSYVLRQLGWI